MHVGVDEIADHGRQVRGGNRPPARGVGASMNAIAARLLVALALAAAVVLAVPGPAACSCGIGDPALMLEHADAALVGRWSGPRLRWASARATGRSASSSG